MEEQEDLTSEETERGIMNSYKVYRESDSAQGKIVKLRIDESG